LTIRGTYALQGLLHGFTLPPLTSEVHGKLIHGKMAKKEDPFPLGVSGGYKVAIAWVKGAKSLPSSEYPMIHRGRGSPRAGVKARWEIVDKSRHGSLRILHRPGHLLAAQLNQIFKFPSGGSG